MSRKKTTKVTFRQAGKVPPEVVMHLTADQAGARRHLLTPVKDWHSKETAAKRLPFSAKEPVLFKAGEELELDLVDGKIPPSLAEAMAGTEPAEVPALDATARDENGDTPEMAALRKSFDASWTGLQKQLAEAKAAIDVARAEGHAAGRAELLAEVEQRNALIDAADAAAQAVVEATAKHEAEADPEKRKPLQAALDKAIEAQVAADKAVDELPDLKA